MLIRPAPGAGSWKNQGEFQFLLSLLNDVLNILNYEEKKEQKSVAFFQSFKETDPGHVFQHLGQEPGRYSVRVSPGKATTDLDQAATVWFFLGEKEMVLLTHTNFLLYLWFGMGNQGFNNCS